MFVKKNHIEKKGVPIFHLHLPKGVPIFQLFFKRTFQFLIFQLCSIFTNLKNILAIRENLFRETKNLNFEIYKISLRKTLSAGVWVTRPP